MLIKIVTILTHTKILENTESLIITFSYRKNKFSRIKIQAKRKYQYCLSFS